MQELKALGIPATFEEGWDYSSPHGRQYLYTVKVNPKNRRHVKELQRIKDQVLGETDLADQVEAMLNPVGNMLDIILDDTRKAIYFADAAHLEEPAIKLNTAIANLNDLKKPFKCKYYLSNTASYVEAVGSMAGDKLIIEYTFEDTPVKAIWSITPFKKPVLLLGTTVEFEETDSDLADQKG